MRKTVWFVSWLTKVRLNNMLLPNKTKHRKEFKGRIRGVASRGNYIAYGTYGLQAQGHERITSRQIESARQAMTRYIKRGGKIWIRIFPHTPVSRKPQDVKMGSGKGNPEFFAARVKPGTVMFEMEGVTEELAREAMRLAAHKLPVKTKFIVKDQEAK
jgi:large subunit ribosomal protein L16